MGYRFLDDYDPRKETKKKQQNGALSAPRSGNSLNPFAANNKKPSGTSAGGAQTAAAGRTTRGTALGGSAVTPVQMPKLTVPKLTKTTAAQKTTPVKAPQQLKLPTIQAFGAGDYTRAGKTLDRVAKTVKAGAVSAAAGAVEIAGQFRPTTGQQSMGQFSGFGDLGRAVRENRANGTDINESIRRQEQQRRVRQKQSQQNIFAAADRLTEKGQQYEREAKQGLGTVGQFLVDMGVTGTQMAGDALVNLILPGGGLAMMGMRSYGQAAGEARRQGKSEQQQFLAGLKSAGIEVFTEKMFGAFSKVYGGAAADELVEKLVNKMTGNATGQALLTWIINGVGEGVEEVTSDLLNPLADRLLRLDDGKGGIYSTEDLAQWGYDFLLGAAMGIVGGSAQLARGVRQGQAQTAEGRYYDDLRRNGLGSANAADNARRASAAMGRIMPTGDGVRMPQLTTYEQRQEAEYRGEKPQNVNDPRIGRLELSSAKYNPTGADASSVYGNRYRQQVKENAIRRLGIADGKPAYLVASNITKNGQEYYVDVTKASLNKLLFTKNHEPLELERLLLVDNLEKAIDGSYWAESNGDRKGRTQIDGFDTLRASFYIDGIPYYADIKVKVVNRGAGQNPQNVAYYIEPEEITSIGKADTQSPTEGRHAPHIFFRDSVSASNTSVPQGGTGVNMQGMQNGGEYVAPPAAPLQMSRLTDEQGRTYEQRMAAEDAVHVDNPAGDIDAPREATGNGLQAPRLTTYEQREAERRANEATGEQGGTHGDISTNTGIGEVDVREQVRQMDAANEAAAMEAVQQRIVQEYENREMPEALKKLGVEPFGSEADYAGIDNLAQEMRWNNSARKQAQRQMNKIPATEKERTFARRLADGTLDAADIPDTVNRKTVETLADHYRTLDSAPATMLLRQRRAVILEREEAKMEPLLGMDVAYDEGGLRTNGKGDRKNSGRIAKQTSTLRRNLQTPARICATEWGPEHGKKVYEALFYPVTENNGRQIDWVNSMLDRVRTFKDSKGEERPLNRKERELVQKIVEHQASEKRVAAFDEPYKDAVENVRNGATAEDAAKMFGIDPSYQEYQDLQNYETYLKALEDLHDSKSADDMAVGKAVDAYSKLYKELYDGINSFLVAHGYQPIGFIEGYAPHMQPEAEKTAFSKALKLLGLDDTAMSLPTSISGKTADLKPYKQYNPFFQERHGVNTEYDIAKGFEDYVYYLGNIFYHTDDIMRIRMAEKYIRKTYSSEEASELINQAESARDFSNEEIADFLRVSGVVQKGTELAPGDARVFLEDYIGKLYDQVGNVTRYSEMAKYLDNYANRLAGKQNMADRGAEAATGRGSLNWINTLTGKYGGAKLAFNVSSALNQTSQIPMVAAENGEGATARAIGDFFKSKKDRLDFVQESNFLKGKRGIDWLLGPETGWEKFKEAGFTLTEMVDSFTSFVAVRSKYLKETKAGKNHAEAMKLADEYGRNVMGSRARGEKPMLFDTKNPFWQIVTRFQLEALNSWEHVSRDMPNEVRQMAREQGKAYAAGVMGVRVAKYLGYAFLLNLVVGALSGGSPVPYDVVGSTLEALGKSMGVSKLALVDNVLEAIFDKRLFGTDGGDDDDADKDWWAFVKSLAGDMANDIPIIGQGAAMLGIGDQTLATADLSKVGDFAKSVKKNGLFSMDTLDKGATAAGELFYAGNQARKTLQGGIAVARGGVYSNGKLRYQVDQTPGNILKGVLFGRSALDESQAYYAERTSDFSENQTEAFKQMQDRGVSAKASYDLLQELRGIEKTEESTKAERQREALRQSGVSGAGKWVTYYQTMASETEWKAMDAVQYRSEADYGTVTSLLMDLKEREKDADKMRLIDKSNLSDSQKASLYKTLVAGDEDLEKINALKDAGISDYQYLQYRIATSGLTKKEAKLHAINMLDLDNSQKDALYYLNSYASSTHGDAPWVQGVSAEQSNIRLAAILAAEEDDGDDTPKWLQSLNSYLGKGSGGSEVSEMLENVRRLRYGSSYAAGSDLTVSQMLANVRRLRYGASSTSGVSGGELSVEEMLANVRRRRAELGV
nr:MAG TPA: hypothetical protein [Caudoviricetes sp.]